MCWELFPRFNYWFYHQKNAGKRYLDIPMVKDKMGVIVPEYPYGYPETYIKDGK